MELRIYQNNELLYHNPMAEDIAPIMDRIITFDKVLLPTPLGPIIAVSYTHLTIFYINY